MTIDLANRLLEMLREIRTYQILVIGGEPTLWSPLLVWNKRCRELKMRSVLVTNAMRFGSDDFWQRYLEYPNDQVGVSIKAGNANQLLEATGVRKFALVQKGVQRAVEHFRTGVSITFNSFYSTNLLELVRFAIDCGARAVKIDFCSTVFIDGQAADEYMVEMGGLVQCVLKNYAEMDRVTRGRLMFEMNMPLCVWPRSFIEGLMEKSQMMTVCHALKEEGIVFDTEGSVLMCNGLFDYPVGRMGKDFVDAPTFSAFLHSQTIKDFYRRFRCYPSERCTSCRWYQVCAGGCPLRWALVRPDELVRPVLD